MPTAFLVRHAEPVPHAMHRGTDADRPLSARGHRQAAWIAARLAGQGVSRVLTAPYARCLETAKAIAQRLGLEAQVVQALHIANAFTIDPGDGVVVYVAHSNNIPGALAGAGAECHACGHASCWEVELDQYGRATQARYVPNEA